MSTLLIRTFVAAALAAAALLVAGAADAARAPSPVKSPPVASSPAPTHTITTKPDFGRYGRGYGRGWCYWHPYACYYR